ncbi:hypothetical protein [Tessaracoccus sp. MC1627]|uniref:hypothetical protein n=1 Tax=Tessaracoccus sp. MC1627 TaxID=2760312 RepID=UPI001604931E|nr:hypothetical protein [Tessaracoccus sp. MC1627]MBB1513934.1 hypothetical protein [Tessaracoccus sp. MC1627]
MRTILSVSLTVLILTACVARPDPAPAVLRETAPPWDAPRDAVSYIRAAGLPEQPLGTDTDPWVLDLTVTVDGEPVDIPAFIGADRLRAVQAPVHTHDPGGEVWLEGDGNRDITLGEFFTLWGVRFDDECLGAACGDLMVTADGRRVEAPAELVLRGLTSVSVTA